jgi:stress response protein YsnF
MHASPNTFGDPERVVEPAHREVLDDGESIRALPLQGVPERTARGIILRLPVRAEHVVVRKQPFVVEEAVVRADRSRRVVRVDETARREELTVRTSGDLDVTSPLPSGDPSRVQNARPLL